MENHKTFQSYLDTIKSKTGLGPDDFRELARPKGLVGPDLKTADAMAWLKNDFGLGHGHAITICSLLKRDGAPARTDGEILDALFSGARGSWRPVFESLMGTVRGFGGDVRASPSGSYVSLVRAGKKFAILQPAASHLDIGIKRKGAAPTPRFVASGSWNPMVTHRVRVRSESEVDADVLEWLRGAYEAAG